VITPAEWSRWNVSLRLAVAPAWPAEPDRKVFFGFVFFFSETGPVQIPQPPIRGMEVADDGPLFLKWDPESGEMGQKSPVLRSGRGSTRRSRVAIAAGVAAYAAFHGGP
jgi:hypothetical protein